MDDAEIDRLIENFSVHDREVQEHADEVFRRMRQRCPVSRSVAHGGFYTFSKYRDVYDAEHRTELFSSFPVTLPPFGNAMPMIPIEMDPPAHTKYRKVVGTHFSLASVLEREADIEAIVVDLFERIGDRTEIDLIDALAFPLPMRVLGDLFLEIPKDDQPTLFEHFRTMLDPETAGLTDEQVMERRTAAGAHCQTYLAELLSKRRARPGGDLISFLGQAEIDGARLTDEEILGFLMLLVPAGFDTTASTIGRIFLYLCEHPDAFRRLAGEPDLLPSAIEELLRYTTAVTGQARTVTQDCEFAGVALKKGDRMALLWASGNRDEEVFPDPDEVVLDREPNRHLAFGTGRHRCLGSHVAREMVRLMLREFVRRMPPYRLVEGNPPVWHAGETWGLSTLPVILERPLARRPS